MWIYAIFSVFLVSLVSFVGAVTLAFKKDFLRNILLILVAFSAGALLGDTFIHLLPEAVSESGGFTYSIMFSIFAGIFVFFVLEKFLRWRHCHDIDCAEHPKHIGTMSLVADGVHNLIDGLLIGASYVASIPLGVATTIAVFAHEVPKELGNFGILLHSGFTAKKAIFYNFLFACTAIAGTIVALFFGSKVGDFVSIMIPFTAGGFLYISLSDLVPELHKEDQIHRSLIQLVAILFGIFVMFLLLILLG